MTFLSCNSLTLVTFFLLNLQLKSHKCVTSISHKVTPIFVTLRSPLQPHSLNKTSLTCWPSQTTFLKWKLPPPLNHSYSHTHSSGQLLPPAPPGIYTAPLARLSLLSYSACFLTDFLILTWLAFELWLVSSLEKPTSPLSLTMILSVVSWSFVNLP